MKNPDTDRKARQRANAALAKVQHIAVEPPLPPPWSGLHHATVRTEERAEYRARLARWEETHPGYAASWGRPTVQTAEAVYALVGHLLPIPLEQIHPDPVKAKMLVTVALDAGVVAGRYGTKRSETDRIPRERQVRQHLSRMKFFDVIARRWSPTHRQVREDGKAYSVTQMREDTLHAVRRDLLLEDIAIEKLWRIVTGAWSHSLTSGNPLFHVNRSRSRTDGLNAILTTARP